MRAAAEAERPGNDGSDNDEEDFAMSMFDTMESHNVQRLQRAAEDDEKWWIVMHAKVAVRRLPTTEGNKPISVLPASSVVRAKGIEFANGARWLILQDDDLPLLDKKKQSGAAAATTAAEASSSSSSEGPKPGGYMLLEMPGHGRLLMVAPKSFDWEKVAPLAPKLRGDAARRMMIGDVDAAATVVDAGGGGGGGEEQGLLGDVSDEQIDALLNAYDVKHTPAKDAAKPPVESDTVIGVREAEDGLVDLSIRPARARPRGEEGEGEEEEQTTAGVGHGRAAGGGKWEVIGGAKAAPPTRPAAPPAPAPPATTLQPPTRPAAPPAPAPPATTLQPPTRPAAPPAPAPPATTPQPARSRYEEIMIVQAAQERKARLAKEAEERERGEGRARAGGEEGLLEGGACPCRWAGRVVRRRRPGGGDALEAVARGRPRGREAARRGLLVYEVRELQMLLCVRRHQSVALSRLRSCRAHK